MFVTTSLFVLSSLLLAVNVRADDYYCSTCSGISCAGNFVFASTCECQGAPCFSPSASTGTTTLPSVLSDTLFGVYWVEVPANQQINLDLSSLATSTGVNVKFRSEMYDAGSVVTVQYTSSSGVYTFRRFCTSAEDPFYDQTIYMSLHFQAENSGQFSISNPVPSTLANCPVITSTPTSVPTATPTAVPTSSPTILPTMDTVALTTAPTAAVTTGPFDIYVVGYTDGYCSDYFGKLSVPNGRDGCFSETVDGTLVSVMAECVSPDTSSQWTINVFLSSDCSGSSIASFVGYGYSECAFLSAYGYHISAYVNCANTATYGPSGSSDSGGDDDNAGAIAGGVIGALVGVAIIAGAVYYFAVFKPASSKESLDKEGNAL